MLAPQIIKKLAESRPNGAPGIEVKSLRFRVGPLDVIEGIPQVRALRRVPQPAALSPELERSLMPTSKRIAETADALRAEG